MKRGSFLFFLLGLLAVAAAPGQPREKTTTLAFPVELSQVNPSVPLGDKTPLILIHGWNTAGVGAPPSPGVWANFLAYFEGNPSLAARYKPYTLSFYSNVSTISDLGRMFRDLLDSASAADPTFNNKKVVVIAHSIGGLIARSFMEEHRLNWGVFAGRRGGDRVLNLITLGTPHHGSPLANGPARDEKVKSVPGVAAIVTFFEAYFYSSAGLNYAQLNRVELHWDNYDNLLDYTTFSNERNAYLTQTLNADTTFDSRIIAHVGVIPTALNGPGTGAYVLSNGFGFRSDGFVPEFSAGFIPHTVQKRTTLSGYNHSEMVYGKSGSSELFDALRDDLLLVTGVKDGEPTRPSHFVLEQNYPNPFNPKTVVSFQLSVVSEVRLVVYNLIGGEVATLVNERKEPGRYGARFDGSGLASGVYYYRIIVAPTDGSAAIVETKAMTLLK